MRLDWWKRLGVYGGLATLGLATMTWSAPAAGVQTITHEFVDVTCKSTAGDQAQTISVAITAPDQVEEGSTFTVSFPGGDAALPASALGGSVTITSYSNLSTTLQMKTPGTFVTGTGAADGDTTVDGTAVTATGTVISPTSSRSPSPVRSRPARCTSRHGR